MSEVRVSRRRSDGRETTYCVAVTDETNRTLHNVTVRHNELHGFDSHTDLLTFVFEQLMARTTKENILSSFHLKDLLVQDPELGREVDGFGAAPRRYREETGSEWLMGG